MKNTILIFFFLLIGFKTIAQESSTISEEDRIYSFVQEKASPIDGMTIFYQSFIDEFQIAISRFKDNDAKVRLKFIVEKDGTFSNITSESTNADYGKEAIRVLKRMPAWKPAKHNGETVRSSFIMPINIGDNRVKKNKTINDKFDSKIIDRIVLDQTIETDEFEFQCNCSFYKGIKNPKINQTAKSYKLNDYRGMYSIIIQNNPEKKHIPNFDELLTSKNLVGDKKYIDLNGIKAFQIGNDLDDNGYNVMIMFMKGNNLINIQINAQNKILTEFLVTDFIKTFKLKI